jgi:5-methylcytosine-specific restriction protein B
VEQETIRNALLFRIAMEILRDATGPLPPREVMAQVADQIVLTPYELSTYQSGQSRWYVALGFITGGAATVLWVTKHGGWAITDKGMAALEEFPSAPAVYAEMNRLYAEVDQRRKQAQQNLGENLQFIARALSVVEPGNWTAHDDIAVLVGTTATEVADFLANGQVKLADACRVLNADGSVPSEGLLNPAFRGLDLIGQLTAEGVEFDASARASQAQRLTADALQELLSAPLATEPAQAVTPRRAWMVRGSNVEGQNLVDGWLAEGYVSLTASQLAPFRGVPSFEELRQRVESAYQHKSYAYRAQRLEELDRFLRQVRDSDLVLTTTGGKVYLGQVNGSAYFTDADGGLSGLRRDVRWLNADNPIDASVLPAPVPALLQTQAAIVELTQAYRQIAELVPAEEQPEPVPAPPPELHFHPVTEEFADKLLLDKAELATIAALLWERKQIILYGPPGTGKTWLAEKLARHLTDEGSVKLVQFHPSYTYEDFFEGFRPKDSSDGGTLTFKLTPGPFRSFAEAAAVNSGTPYILVIDEINRANLAKVFGELYYLLEYRDRSISLQYSPDREFTLPPNVFIIGTMNTADRSIARFDAAMRRRFVFVELHPRVPPVRGLLARWLERHDLPNESALLLDELNRRIEDADAAIGPSYLMDERIYAKPDGLGQVWQYQIMPLLEDLFYGQQDLADRYGLPSLRKAVAAGNASEQVPAESDEVENVSGEHQGGS